MLLGLRLRTRALEPMSREVAGDAPAFQDPLPAPSPGEEGPLMVVTAGGEGVPMRRPPQDDPRPHHRRTGGEKADEKQMACVGAACTIGPSVRKADDIRDEVLRGEEVGERPVPQHRRARAEMARQVGGETVKAKGALSSRPGAETAARNKGHGRPVIGLMGGGRASWEMRREHSSGAVGILDLPHALERIGAVAHRLHEEGSDPAREPVEGRLRGLLQGRAGYAIAGRRRRLGGGKLGGPKRGVVGSAVEYLANNREHLRYDG